MNTKRFLCAALGAVCYFAFLQAQVRTCLLYTSDAADE